VPSKITISIETDDGPRRDLHTVVVPDLPPDQGQGSRLRAERLAAIAVGAIVEEIGPGQ
jgi:hypothetical protein